jgi:hypothetical protein
MNPINLETVNPEELDPRVMPQLCLDCGFEKVTTQADFLSHMWLHEDLDEILGALGVEQERLDVQISFAEAPEVD